MTLALARREGLLAPFREDELEFMDFRPDGGGVSLPSSLAADGSEGVGENMSSPGVFGGIASRGSSNEGAISTV